MNVLLTFNSVNREEQTHWGVMVNIKHGVVGPMCVIGGGLTVAVFLQAGVTFGVSVIAGIIVVLLILVFFEDSSDRW